MSVTYQKTIAYRVTLPDARDGEDAVKQLQFLVDCFDEQTEYAEPVTPEGLVDVAINYKHEPLLEGLVEILDEDLWKEES